MPLPATPTLLNPVSNSALSTSQRFAKFNSRVDFNSAPSNASTGGSSKTSLNASASASDESNKQSLASSTFSLVKAIVGSGVLALPG